MKKIFLLLLPLLLCSCTSIPLSTIAKMSTFGWEDFQSLQAEEVQVKITVPEGFHLDVENSWLGVDITSVANAYQSVFKLQENTKPAVLEHSSFFGEASKATVYNLQLNSQSQAEFAELQKYLQKSQAEGVAIRVVPKLASYPQAADNVEISIDLQLSSEEGYFTLIDGAELSLAKLRSKK